MEQWLAAIEQLGAVRLLKTSFFAYPIVNALHIAAVGALLTSVVLMDLRLLGRFPQLDAQPFLTLLRRLALGAFGFAVASGATLFSVRATEYGATPLFLVKMALIAAAGLNFLAFAAMERRRHLGEGPTPAMRLSAGLSVLLWGSVLLAGRFLGFV